MALHIFMAFRRAFARGFFPVRRLVRLGACSTLAEKMASAMLAHSGTAVIWGLTSPPLRPKTKPELGASLMEVAEAAERLWAAHTKAR
jgi:hypothetical protein